jgi:phosphopantothenoylcysteine synthetase/decarboxylase
LQAQVKECIQTLAHVALQAASEVNMQYSEQAQQGMKRLEAETWNQAGRIHSRRAAEGYNPLRC